LVFITYWSLSLDLNFKKRFGLEYAPMGSDILSRIENSFQFSHSFSTEEATMKWILD
jgi:hypothetical protein